jgi:hypothetical protein
MTSSSTSPNNDNDVSDNQNKHHVLEEEFSPDDIELMSNERSETTSLSPSNNVHQIVHVISEEKIEPMPGGRRTVTPVLKSPSLENISADSSKVKATSELKVESKSISSQDAFRAVAGAVSKTWLDSVDQNMFGTKRNNKDDKNEKQVLRYISCIVAIYPNEYLGKESVNYGGCCINRNSLYEASCGLESCSD